MIRKQCEIWVYIECDQTGQSKKSSLELLTLGRRLANSLQRKLTAIIMGKHPEMAVVQVETCNVDRVRILPMDADLISQPETYIDQLFGLIQLYQPLVLLFAATTAGRDLAPATAAAANSAFFANCQDVRVSKENGQLIWKQLSFGGSLISESSSYKKCAQVGTIRLGLFPKPEAMESYAVLIREHISKELIPASRTVWEDLRHVDDSSLRIEEADVIVAGGHGARGPEGFLLIRELAKELNGVVGASRVAVDKGWAPKTALIGQSGKTVTPKLYINCGISGSIQHIMGMRNAAYVVSINTDPKALIFAVSDCAIVGDMFQVLPVLIQKIKKIKRR